MYDISRFNSLTNLEEWLKVVKKGYDDETEYFPVLLVGGKSDLEEEGKRVIQAEFAAEYGKKHNLFDFIECSSKTGVNVENVFISIARKMMILSGLI